MAEREVIREREAPDRRVPDRGYTPGHEPGLSGSGSGCAAGVTMPSRGGCPGDDPAWRGHTLN